MHTCPLLIENKTNKSPSLPSCLEDKDSSFPDSGHTIITVSSPKAPFIKTETKTKPNKHKRPQEICVLFSQCYLGALFLYISINKPDSSLALQLLTPSKILEIICPHLCRVLFLFCVVFTLYCSLCTTNRLVMLPPSCMCVCEFIYIHMCVCVCVTHVLA